MISLTQVLHLRSEGATLKEIGLKHKITSERVRQIILNKNRKRCKKHEVFFFKTCNYCRVEKEYKQHLKKFKSVDPFLGEAVNLRPHNRIKELVIKRRLFIKVLRDKYEWSYRSIGRLLDRDHHSVINLYNGA